MHTNVRMAEKFGKQKKILFIAVVPHQYSVLHLLSCSDDACFEWEGCPGSTQKMHHHGSKGYLANSDCANLACVFVPFDATTYSSIQARSPRGQTGIAIAGQFQTGGRSCSSGQIARRASISCAASDSSMAAAAATAFSEGWASCPDAEVRRRLDLQASLSRMVLTCWGLALRSNTTQRGHRFAAEHRFTAESP